MTRDEILAGLTDEMALTATLLGECAGEAIEGQIAVACVVRNRAQHPRWWGGGSYRSVCLAEKQFSCWWEDHAANTQRVFQIAEALVTKQPLGERTLLTQLRWIAQGVIGEQLPDVTRTSDHYLTKRLLESPRCPDWARGRTPAYVCHEHVFFRLEI